MFWFFILFFINLAISFSNANQLGKYWYLSKEMGRGVRISAIAVYAMTVVGFTQAFLIIAGFLAVMILPMFPQYASYAHLIMSLTFDVTYIMIATAIIPAGLIMWFNSAVHFWRNKNLSNGAVLGWNTFAQINNIRSVSRGVPAAIARIRKSIEDAVSNGKKPTVLVALLIVLLVVASGFMTSKFLIDRSDRKHNPNRIKKMS